MQTHHRVKLLSLTRIYAAVVILSQINNLSWARQRSTLPDAHTARTPEQARSISVDTQTHSSAGGGSNGSGEVASSTLGKGPKQS